ncbi:MAG: MFS transporter, partial [bacterium]|nr:MFS transporter [bacterium]
HVTTLPGAIVVLVLIGACGGFYVVPLNALLQERGHETVGAGHAIAVQNFFENLTMLLLIGVYVLMTKADMPIVSAATWFGALVLMGIGLLAWWRLASREAAGR